MMLKKHPGETPSRHSADLDAAKRVLVGDNGGDSDGNDDRREARVVRGRASLMALEAAASRQADVLRHLKATFAGTTNAGNRLTAAAVAPTAPFGRSTAVVDTAPKPPSAAGILATAAVATDAAEAHRGERPPAAASTATAAPPNAPSHESSLRVKLLHELTRDLRRECAALTQQLLQATPPGMFSDLFPECEHRDPLTCLPPPPSEDDMLQHFQLQGLIDAKAKRAESEQEFLEAKLKALQQEARWSLTTKATDFLLAPPPLNAPHPTARVPNPLQVTGMAPTPEEEIDVARVAQYVREAHALMLLTHIAQIAPQLDADGGGGSSRGSSVTPQITPITSTLDHHSMAAAAAGTSRVLENSHNTSVVILPTQHAATHATRQIPSSHLVPPIATDQQKVTQNASHGNDSSVFPRSDLLHADASSLLSGRPAAPVVGKSQQQQQQQQRVVAVSFATTTGSVSEESLMPPPNGEVVVSRKVSSESSSNSASAAAVSSRQHSKVTSGGGGGDASSPSDPSTVRDTSTAATGGSDHTNSSSAMLVEPPMSKPSSKVGWTESQSREGSAASTSSSTRRKRSKGLFACIQRDDSDGEEQSSRRP